MFDRLSSLRDRLQLDDDELQQAILEDLESDPAYHHGRRLRVSVEVNDGEVTVRGSVRTPLERRKVDIVARAVGAMKVNNEVVVAEDRPEPRKRTLQTR